VALIIPTPSNDTDRTRSENAEIENVDHKGEAEPPLDQLAQCKPTMKSSKNKMQQPERKPHGQGRKPNITKKKINSNIRSIKKKKHNSALTPWRGGGNPS
jgi:hypothetical protein